MRVNKRDSLTCFLILIIFLLSVSPCIQGQIPDSADTAREITLGGVEITGQRTPAVYSQIARKITVISTEHIIRLPAITLNDLLKYAGSIDIRERNVHGVQADIQVRGGTFDQVMILLNGINITDPQSGHFNLDLPVELSSIERIEILHGSGARLYGANAYKGIINIITKKNIDNLAAGFMYGQHNLIHSFISAGVNSGKTFHSLNLSGNSSDGFRVNTDYQINNIYYQGNFKMEYLTVNWQAGHNQKSFGANDFYSPLFPDQYEETSTGYGSLGFEVKKRIDIAGTAFWRRHYDNFLLKRDNPSFYENYHLTDIYGFRINSGFSSRLGKSSFGLEDRYESILSTLLGEETTVPVKVKHTDSTWYDRQYSRNTFGVFFEHIYKLNDLSLTGGFLINAISKNTKRISFFPGIDISYMLLNEKMKIFTSVNRSLRLPTFTDMFYKDPVNEGNKSLVPENVFALEAGMTFNTDDLSASVTLFRDDGKNVIDWIWIEESHLYKADNVASVLTKGIEMSGEYRFKNNRENFIRFYNLETTYAHTLLNKSAGEYESKYSLDYLKHRLILGITWNIMGKLYNTWNLGYRSRNGTYISYDVPEDPPVIKSFQPYWMADTKIYFTVRSFKFNLEISDLFNTARTDLGNLIPPGRWITAGIMLDLEL